MIYTNVRQLKWDIDFWSKIRYAKIKDFGLKRVQVWHKACAAPLAHTKNLFGVSPSSTGTLFKEDKDKEVPRYGNLFNYHKCA